MSNSRVCLFGASPDTGNLGVSALWHSASSGLLSRIPNLELTVFDMLRGSRDDKIRVGEQDLPYRRIAANPSRRYYSPDSLWNMWMAAKTGGKWNRGVQAIREADAVVDVSGGDSFSDIYGTARFKAIAMHKQLAMQQGTPLILLPQTYGPFDNPKNRELAAELVRYADAAWARDERSYQHMKELIGSDFDPSKHHSGVDMAFGLDRYPPQKPLSEPAASWIEDRGDRILVGVNVSGLLYGKFESNITDFGFKAHYATIIHELCRRLLTDPKVVVLLVPHVYGAAESDNQACETAERVLSEYRGDRLGILSARLDQSEIKWVISNLDWFCGTRMHSAIAALSSGVPAAAIAYSLKTEGVFESCGQGDHVADPRRLDTLSVIDKLCASFHARDEARATLAERLPEVRQRADAQMDAIAALCQRTPQAQ